MTRKQRSSTGERVTAHEPGGGNWEPDAGRENTADCDTVGFTELTEASVECEDLRVEGGAEKRSSGCARGWSTTVE